MNKNLENLLLCLFCSSPFSTWILLPVLFFYFIAGEKCNFQVKFAFVQPHVCKNYLGNQKRHFSSGRNQFCIMNENLENLLLCLFCSSPFSAWILLPVLFFTSSRVKSAIFRSNSRLCTLLFAKIDSNQVMQKRHFSSATHWAVKHQNSLINIYLKICKNSLPFILFDDMCTKVSNAKCTKEVLVFRLTQFNNIELKCVQN